MVSAPPKPRPPGKTTLGVMLERAIYDGQCSAMTREGSLSVYYRGWRDDDLGAYLYRLNGWPVDAERAARLLA